MDGSKALLFAQAQENQHDRWNDDEEDQPGEQRREHEPGQQTRAPLEDRGCLTRCSLSSEPVISLCLQRSHQFVNLRGLFANILERLHIGELISGWEAGRIVALRRREQLARRDVWI